MAWVKGAETAGKPKGDIADIKSRPNLALYINEKHE